MNLPDRHFSTNEPETDGLFPLEIEVADVKRLMESEREFVFLDCREPMEYEICHLPGATLVPMRQLPAWAGSQSQRRADHIVVLCHHGVRSYHAAQWLRANGFGKAQSVAGGIDHWSARIDPSVPRY